ncbi:MAG: TIGR00296 family protein [Methanobacteriota archaeon]|nr:MAG: TIGR00296 family protein [Euryarchaeota archaeon]
MSMFSDDEGKMAVGIARSAIENHIRSDQPPDFEVPDVFNRRSGVFVTLTTHPDNGLRGCIGYPEPVVPLIQALIDSAINAASRDPRFSPISEAELDRIRVEVSLLTPPEEISVSDVADLPKRIKVGEDGLIVQRDGARGLLLPQVAVEWGWDSEEFLCQACMKAGVSPDAWLMPGTKISIFRAEVFSETEPQGNVVRRELDEQHGCSR